MSRVKLLCLVCFLALLDWASLSQAMRPNGQWGGHGHGRGNHRRNRGRGGHPSWQQQEEDEDDSHPDSSTPTTLTPTVIAYIPWSTLTLMKSVRQPGPALGCTRPTASGVRCKPKAGAAEEYET